MGENPLNGKGTTSFERIRNSLFLCENTSGLSKHTDLSGIRHNVMESAYDNDAGKYRAGCDA